MKPKTTGYLCLFLSIFLCLVMITQAVQAASVWLNKAVNSQGFPIIQVVNQTPRNLYCWVTFNNGYGYFDFYVGANSTSQWYFEPQGYYQWQCK